MADENQGQQGQEASTPVEGATAPAPEGWDQAFGADAPKPHVPPAPEEQAAWQQPAGAETGPYGAAATQGQGGTTPYATGNGFGGQPPQNPSGSAWQQPAAPTPVPPVYAKSCLSAGWADCKQPGFWKKTAFLGLLELVPILNFVNAGYALEWCKEVPFGGRTELPKKVITGRNFEIGFYAFVIALVFSLVGSFAGGIVGFVPLVGWIAAIAIGFLASMFSTILNLRMAIRSQLGEGFKVSDAWTAVKRDWAGLLCVVIVPALIAGAVIFVLSLVYAVVAMLFVIPIVGAAAYPDPTLIVGAVLGGGLGFLLVTLVFCYAVAWAAAAAQLVMYRAAAHWVARYAGDWTYVA